MAFRLVIRQIHAGYYEGTVLDLVNEWTWLLLLAAVDCELRPLLRFTIY